MKIISCVKLEELYIKEWIDYHLSIGFDHFYLIDNNDLDYFPTLYFIVKNYVDEGIVDVIDCRGIHPILPIGYNKVLEKFGNSNDWYAIIDVDEFIALPKDKNIKTFLSKFEDTDIVYLHWMYYGDNNLIQYENKPVLERFKIPFKKSSYIKSIFRLKKISKIKNLHTIVEKFDNIIRKNCLGELNTKKTGYIVEYKEKEFEVAYIKHYITKSLEEYMTIKRLRGGALLKNQDNFYKRYDIKNYFLYNLITPNKIKYLKENFGINMNYYLINKKIDEFNFCYIIDDNEELMLMLKNSIESLLKYFKNYNPNIYIINLENFDSDSSKKLKTFSTSIKEIKKIYYLDKNLCKIFPFPKNSNNSSYLGYNSLSRFFIPYILECRYVYYVDNDILFTKDFYNDLMYFDFLNTYFRFWIQHNGQKLSNNDHFNAGFMFINCKKCRQDKNLFNFILSYYVNNINNIKFMNLSCYKWLATESKYKSSCIIEKDIDINNHSLYNGIKLFHGNGRYKNYYWECYNELYKKCK